MIDRDITVVDGIFDCYKSSSVYPVSCGYIYINPGAVISKVFIIHSMVRCVFNRLNNMFILQLLAVISKGKPELE